MCLSSCLVYVPDVWINLQKIFKRSIKKQQQKRNKNGLPLFRVLRFFLSFYINNKKRLQIKCLELRSLTLSRFFVPLIEEIKSTVESGYKVLGLLRLSAIKCVFGWGVSFFQDRSDCATNLLFESYSEFMKSSIDSQCMTNDRCSWYDPLHHLNTCGFFWTRPNIFTTEWYQYVVRHFAFNFYLQTFKYL